MTEAHQFRHAWVVSVVSAADGPVDAAPVDPVRLIEQRARDLLETGDVPTAREVAEEALRTSPDRPELLWLLADVEFADGDQQSGVCCLAKAVDVSGRDAAAISRQIRTLSENDLWREALMTVEHVPGQVRGDPLVRRRSVISTRRFTVMGTQSAATGTVPDCHLPEKNSAVSRGYVPAVRSHSRAAGSMHGRTLSYCPTCAKANVPLLSWMRCLIWIAIRRTG